MRVLTLPFLLLVMVFCMIFCASGTAFAAEAVVQRVDFYPSGAKFVFTIEPGPEGFQVDLPGAFQASSVRLLNPKDADDFKAVEGKREVWVPPALAKLRADMDAQSRVVKALSARRAALEQTQELLDSVRPKDTDAAALLTYIERAQELKLKVENELVELSGTMEEEQE